jgi:choline dehydrogenase-like flavoprotein
MNPLTANVITAPAAELRTEIAVIGSGPGGAITAALLAEAGREVLLVEQGPLLPLDSCAPFSAQEMVQKYRNGGITVALGRTKVAYVEGCCVGGGSEINSGFAHRLPPEILHQWRQRYRVECLTESDLQPHFGACGRDVCVSYLPGPAPAASVKLKQGAERLSWKSRETPRWIRYPSPASTQAPPEGRRQSMTETYVPRLLAAGGRLLPETRARRVFRQGGRWQIQTEHLAGGKPGGRITIAAQTVFVSCGAIHTAALLRRSGITRNVGDSLRMHPTVKVVARFPEEVNALGMGVPVHQVHEFFPRFSFGCSISSPPYLALAMADHPQHARQLHRQWRQMAVYYAMIRGGRGSVRNVAGFRDPLVRFELAPEDFRELAEALRNLCRCLLAAGAVALYPPIPGLGPWTAESDLSQLPASLPSGKTNLMTIHLLSTCPMGEHRRRCAADSFGKVHGIDEMYLADGSLLCEPPGLNPQGAIMALARRNALRFLGGL